MNRPRDASKTVFISYRRRPSNHLADHLSSYLRHHRYDVFLDTEKIDNGRFEGVILPNLDVRTHFIVLLAPGTLERTVSPDDWVRREIERALDRDRNIIPVLTAGFRFGSAEARRYLVGKLARLADYNALELPDGYKQEAFERLRVCYLRDPDELIRRRLAGDAGRLAAEDEANEYISDAISWLNRGDFEQAEAAASAAIRARPDFDFAYAKRGAARYAQGEYAGAIADYSEVLRLQPNNADAHYQRGLARQAAGLLMAALRDYDDTIRLDADHAQAYYRRGCVRQLQHNLAGAADDLTRALALNPGLVEAYIRRGSVRQTRGDLAGAIHDYNAAIRLRPDLSEAYYYRGFLRHILSDVAAALTDYDEAIRLKLRFVDVYYHRAAARRLTGDLAGALADYQHYLRVGGGQQFGNQHEVEHRIAELRQYLGG